MKKLIKLILVAAFGITSLVTAPVQAANDSASVNVTVALTSKCVFGAIAPVAFTYTSFGAAATGTGGTFLMKCTNTMPYTLGFDATATPAATSGLITDAATGLQYNLGLSSTTGPGTGLDKSYTVTGTMAAGQAGTCLTASCNNGAGVAKTVYVVY